MRLAMLVFALTVQVRLSGQPAILSVVNAFSGDSFTAPGTLISIYGSNLSSLAAQATGLPLPFELAGTVVQINGANIPLYYVSPNQINAQIPFEAAGGPAQVRVRTIAGDSQMVSLSLSATAPALLSRIGNGNGNGFFLNSDFQVIDTFSADEYIVLYATGLGGTTPPAVSGMGGAQTEPLNRVSLMPQVYIGDTAAQVLYCGLAPGLVGVYQINVRVPRTLHTDRVFVQMGKAQSNTLSFPQTNAGTTSVYVSTGEASGDTYVFDSGVSNGQKILLQQSMELGARYFKLQNFGDPGTTRVFALSDLANLKRIYANWFNIPLAVAETQFREGVSGAGVIFFSSAFVPSSAVDFRRIQVNVHELFHVLQSRLVGAGGLIGPRPENQVPVGGPRWLIEGSAEYMSYSAIGDAGLFPFTKAFAEQLSNARKEVLPLESLETLPGIDTNGAYALGFVAVDLLVQKSGRAALAQFWRVISTGTSWQDAFLASFGESIAQFYLDFANYRASMLPELPAAPVLSGRVTDASGIPFPGISVYGCPHNPAGSCGYSLTGSDGSYRISATDNVYTLSFGRTTDGAKPDGFYTNSGFTTDQSQATLIQVAGKDVVNLNVQMPFKR